MIVTCCIFIKPAYFKTTSSIHGFVFQLQCRKPIALRITFLWKEAWRMMSHINHCITMSMKIYRFVILFLNISILLLLKQGRPMNNNITKNQFWRKKIKNDDKVFFPHQLSMFTFFNVFFCDNTTNWFFNVQSNILKRRIVG